MAVFMSVFVFMFMPVFVFMFVPAVTSALLVRMSVMMVMVMVPHACTGAYRAMRFKAFLVLSFKLQGRVGNAVCGKRILNGFFERGGGGARYDVHGCVVALSVHAPNVNVVNAKHAVDLLHVLADLLRVNSVGRLFKK